jgi:hypothetical protein
MKTDKEKVLALLKRFEIERAGGGEGLRWTIPMISLHTNLSPLRAKNALDELLAEGRVQESEDFYYAKI